MNLADWVAKLGVAGRLDSTPLMRAAEVAARRASAASGGKYIFHVERTRTGARIIGYSLVNAPARLGDEFVRRMIGPELERARSEIAANARENLSP